VLSRAGDCPLYVEQCVRLLLENGAVAVDEHGARVLDAERLRDIPSSMRLFVSSRLDALPDAERTVLGTAAVLGAEPDLALLGHLVGGHADEIDRLVSAGFLRWSRASAGNPQLSFSHALVRDIAYESTLRSRRVEIHRAAAQWYAVLPVAQVLESQAYHLEAAVELEEPDCELLRKTVEAMVLYARSVEEERTSVSRDVLVRARALADRRQECGVDRLALELGWAAVSELGGQADEAGRAARTALALAEERQDNAARAEACLQLARTVRFIDEQLAADRLAAAEEAYGVVGDTAGVARVQIERGIQAGHKHGLTSYLTHLEQAFHQAMRSSDVRLQAGCAQLLAMHHAFVRGRASFEEWAARARDVARADDVGVEQRLDLALAGLAFFGLDPNEGLEASQRALAGGRDLGIVHVYSNALVTTLELLVSAGRLDSAERLLPEAHAHGDSRPSPWLGLQFWLAEARLRSRLGDVAAAQQALEHVASFDLSDVAVLRRDLAEARAWVALERGRFGEARALAAEAVTADEDMDERCASLRPRLIEIVAGAALGDSIPLGSIASIRSLARETGLGTVAQLANRWLYVEELTHGWSVDLHGLVECGVIECRALDLEIAALSNRDWPLLLRAAEVWAELGTTVWRARALLWHSELTGAMSPEADEILAALDAPADLAQQLRAQVRELRS
jgi:hypothetical protein